MSLPRCTLLRGSRGMLPQKILHTEAATWLIASFGLKFNEKSDVNKEKKGHFSDIKGARITFGRKVRGACGGPWLLRH